MPMSTSDFVAKQSPLLPRIQISNTEIHWSYPQIQLGAKVIPQALGLLMEKALDYLSFSGAK